MELKLNWFGFGTISNDILIVPDGIETFDCSKYTNCRHCILIVPDGIETYILSG